MFPIDFSTVKDSMFRKLIKPISKHQYDMVIYKPDGTFSNQRVKIEDVTGRFGKDMFYELRHHTSWRLITEKEFNRLHDSWVEKNQKFLETQQKAVVELNHENASVID